MFILCCESNRMDNERMNRPPLMGSWKGWYLLVGGVLVAMIIVLSFLTEYFR